MTQRSQKGKYPGKVPVRQLSSAWIKAYRRVNGKWPTPSEVIAGVNAEHPKVKDGPLEPSNRRTISQYLTNFRAEEKAHGELAYAPSKKLLQDPLDTSEKRDEVKQEVTNKPGERLSERHPTLFSRLHETRTLADACAERAAEGNPDFLAYTKLVDLEVKLAEKLDAEIVRLADNESTENAHAPLEALIQIELSRGK